MRSWTRLGPWLVRRFALDRNPLRRRSDRIEAWILLAMIVAFVPLTILTTVSAIHWAEQHGSRQRAEQHLQEVSAVLLQAAPATDPAVDGSVSMQVRARWPVNGATHVGDIAVVPGTARGTTVQIWITKKGNAAPPPLTSAQMDARVVAAIVLAPAAVALALWLMLCLLRWPLNRSRLASWAASWTSVGPRWTQRL
ncbi:MAG TPA: hypothetical protein VME44_27105 [Streptosporangiaceae bacterium]|nr:hypothetical protein [Streptosporangiaceae bacterium]